MSHTIEEIRAAFSRIMDHATNRDPKRLAPFMSIPADERRDADLIVEAAITELAELRDKLVTEQAQGERLRDQLEALKLSLMGIEYEISAAFAQMEKGGMRVSTNVRVGLLPNMEQSLRWARKGLAALSDTGEPREGERLSQADRQRLADVAAAYERGEPWTRPKEPKP